MFYYGKVAFTTSNISQYGKTSFGIDYFKIEDSRANGEDGTSYSAHVVQNLNPVGAQLYLSARYMKKMSAMVPLPVIQMTYSSLSLVPELNSNHSC